MDRSELSAGQPGAQEGDEESGKNGCEKNHSRSLSLETATHAGRKTTQAATVAGCACAQDQQDQGQNEEGDPNIIRSE
jgi:hypothetical protein